MAKKEQIYRIVVSVYSNGAYKHTEHIGNMETLHKELKKFIGTTIPKNHTALIKALKTYTKKNENDKSGTYFQVWEL